MDNSKTYRIFVYGTLMKGGRNSYLLNDGNATLIAENILTKENDFLMVQFNSSSSVGNFSPAVLVGGDGFIRGEIYEVNEDGLMALDRLEGNGHHYQREEVELNNGARAWMYILMREDAPSNEQDRVHFNPDTKIYAWERVETTLKI